MEGLLPKPREMDFNATNLAVTWKKWKQNMEFYLTALMRTKSEEEKYSVFLFLTGQQGRDICNTFEWEKKTDATGNQREEDDITIKGLFKKFEEYCLPKKNLVVERRKFFWRNQHDEKTFDQFLTELRNLPASCEFQNLNESLVLYKVVDGIKSDKCCDVLLRKGAKMTLEKAINICRTEEIIKIQMQEMTNEKEVCSVRRKSGKEQKSCQQKSVQKKPANEVSGTKCKYCGTRNAGSGIWMCSVSPIHLWKKVTVQSDHKPLEAIMKKPLQNTPPQLQRMLLTLQKYKIELKYLSGKETFWQMHYQELTSTKLQKTYQKKNLQHKFI